MHVTQCAAMTREVSARKVAVAAGAIAAVYVAILFTMRTVPDRVVGKLGGPTGVDRWGGVVAKIQPPRGGVRTIDLIGIKHESAEDAIDMLAGGGLEMHEVREGDYATQVGNVPAEGVTVDVDEWMPDDGGPRHSVAYLRGPTRAALEHAIAAAQASGRLVLPADSVIGYERSDSEEGRHRGTSWRTYELAARVELDGTAIARATQAYDPNTNRPIVLLDFTPEAADRFCELTRRIAGKKLATLIGQRIYTAPIINAPICHGRAQITMGGSDPEREQDEAATTVAVLTGIRAPAVKVLDWHWQPSVTPTGTLWLARGLLGLLAGLVLGWLVYALIRIARPRWRMPAPRLTGSFPWRRLLVTLLAPILMIVLPRFSLPSVNDEEMMHMIRHSLVGMFDQGYDPSQTSVIALGVTPLLTSFFIVELVALLVPRWRWRRHDPRGRVALGRATAIAALAIALVQGWFLATYIEHLNIGGYVVAEHPGLQFRLMTMLTLSAGTMLLAVLAGVIREHGLGNGYGALLASGSIAVVLGQVYEEGPGLLLYAYVALAAVAFVVAATWCVLRWRIGDDDGRAELRVPSSGLEALGPLGGIGYVLGALIGLGLGVGILDLQQWLFAFEIKPWVTYGSLAVFVPVWAWILARPSVVARVAMQGGMPAPSRAMWARGALVSLALFVLAFVVTATARGTSEISRWAVGTSPAILLATAVMMDLVDDARARRARLVAVGLIHQIQYAGVVERVLADAVIPCQLHASNLRTLLAFFGPWAPVMVLVPEDHAPAARAKIDDVLQVARGKLPAARIEKPAGAAS